MALLAMLVVVVLALRVSCEVVVAVFASRVSYEARSSVAVALPGSGSGSDIGEEEG